ncbi:hypothetical protein [Bradyrhizobium erythrophlei]|jgi:hypothetical protein|uniref:Uncharacterized protein n=1 Tax=Bradyrhizobium erythrophlei TaxID=1437360 RepID=A0A1M5PTK4_9BRAD|nr:hypothetical protein [Bradyrhizobium erythrophlei]SHH05118.1 hypothetical protein SAMN05444169_5463 [Bradyrhizobium erythrophlei]
MNAPVVNIIDAINGRDLFEPWFPGPSWNAWRVILKAAFCIPLDGGELEIFRALAGDRAPPERQVKDFGSSPAAGPVMSNIEATSFDGQAPAFDGLGSFPNGDHHG